MALPPPPPNHVLAKYGLTKEDWWAMLEAQDFRCPVCARTFTMRRRPVVDHNHRTGEVRGLLCSPDNRSLGVLHENAEWLWNAYTYLTKPPSRDIFETPRRHVDAPPLEQS
jgi:hypothetical protein